MARLKHLHPDLAEFLRDYECPKIDTGAWQPGPPASARRVALVSSAGLRRRDDRPFSTSSSDYRIIPLDRGHEVVQDHASVDHDRTGFTQDLNVAFPLDRLVELAEAARSARSRTTTTRSWARPAPPRWSRRPGGSPRPCAAMGSTRWCSARSDRCARPP